jgi:hypothetical protein
MESTPDSGVEMRKAVVAPLLAPCFWRETAAGRTPQEQRGRGTPKSAALITELNLPDPRCVATVVGFKNTLSTPERRIPNRIYTEESSRSAHDS